MPEEIFCGKSRILRQQQDRQVKHSMTESVGGARVLSQISIFGVKSENWVSEIQLLTDSQMLEKANLRQNPYRPAQSAY
jgi:hypothetical protein